MPFLFHQNMHQFGGGTDNRNNAYQAAFGLILNALLAAPGGGPIVVAGFTEITNNITATNALRGGIPNINLCGALGVTWQATIICRRTAAGINEYTGIGTNLPFPPILSFGRVLIHAVGGGYGGPGGIHLIHDIAPHGAGFANWCSNLPPNATVDYQGLVYVVVTINGNRVAVAYTHNLYSINDNRAALTQNLPHAVALIRANPALLQNPNAVVYVCGDFNCDPRVRRDHHELRLQPYAQGTLPVGGFPAQFALTPAQFAGGVPIGGTTRGRTNMEPNLYDYSFSTIQPVGPPNAIPAARIDVSTLDLFNGGAGLMSDHVASILRV